MDGASGGGDGLLPGGDVGDVVVLVTGSLFALFRSRWADAVYRSVSYDDGETWSQPRPLDAPNNNPSIQYVPLADGRLALVHNHCSAADAVARRASLYDEIGDEGLREGPAEGATGEEPADAGATGASYWGAPRAPLTLSVSSDGGLTWPVRYDLETGDGHCLTNNSRDGLNRELCYPAVVQAPDGTLHIACTRHRRTIKYLRPSPAWADREIPV